MSMMNQEEEDERFYRDTESVAFVKLDDRQLALLEPLGKRRMLRGGEFVFKTGQRNVGLTVILSRRTRGLRSARRPRANPGRAAGIGKVHFNVACASSA